MSRRNFLAGAAAVGVGALGLPAHVLAEDLALARSPETPPPASGGTFMRGVPFAQHDVVRVAIVGTGLRGRGILRELLAIDGVRVTAIADLVPDKAARANKMITDAGQPAPAVFAGTETGFEQLVQRDDIDLVYTATPWEWHVPVCLAAMRNGKHAATECNAGMTLRDLWALVDTSEATGKHCLQLENCCYGQSEMLVNRLVHAGVLGEVLHCEAAYLHDLREILFETRDEGLWRRAWHTKFNGNLYPTHGLGPVSWYLDIHNGDRFDYLVSMSSPEAGLTAHRAATIKDQNDPRWAERYVTGDLNSSLIKTAKGRTILLQHNVSSPRPYSRLNNVQGTKGVFEDYPPRIYVDGQAGGERFGSLDPWKAEYDHPLWKNVGELARKTGGHGGMDFIMCWRLVQCFREGLAPDFDVYDAAAWSAPFALSAMSVSRQSAPVKFPDFTRGRWNTPLVARG
ncbi:MAG: Gfo/Idh/MocA family oxidoreductase [Gemmatimonadaceae bacterium]|nr:Gfo/Idh/MocA family oxidoreductase [Gemmatimonadaceae bacterium]